MYFIFFICVMMFLVSCGGKSDSILSYSADDIYLKCVNYDNIITGFPQGLLILESGEQLEYALNNYEYLDVFSSELSAITTEYPIGEYVYVIQYFERSYGSEFVCNKLYIDKNEMTIHFEYKDKTPLRRDGPAAVSASIVYAVLPKEYLNSYDFSNQQGVLYLGK